MIGVLRDIRSLLDLRTQIVTAVLLAGAQSLALIPIALLVRRIFDRDIARGDEQAIIVGGLLVAACAALSAAAIAATRSYTARISHEAVGRLRADLAATVMTQPLAWHDQRPPGELHAAVVRDCEDVDRMARTLVGQALPAVVTLVPLGVVSVILSPVLSAVLAVTVPLTIVATRAFAHVFRRRAVLWQQAAHRLSDRWQVLLGGLPTIRASGAEQEQIARFSQEIDHYADASAHAARSEARYVAAHGAAATGIGVIVLVVGGILVNRGTMSTGAMLAFYAIMALGLRQTAGLSNAVPRLIEGAAALDRVQALLRSAPGDAYGGTDVIAFHGRMTMRGVGFAYGDREVLAGVDLDLAPGDRVALMGANGAGKTTVAALLLGLYRPDHGRVLADDIPLEDLDLPGLRRQLGVALQDSVLLPGSIAHNIALGRPDATPAQVAEAARLAEADRLTPDALASPATALGDDALKLSGGQRQRVVLARALLTRPALLVLDEPTAHLPEDVADRVIGNLLTLPWRPTILLITHDADIAARMDRTLHLTRGRLPCPHPRTEVLQ